MCGIDLQYSTQEDAMEDLLRLGLYGFFYLSEPVAFDLISAPLDHDSRFVT